MKIYLHCGAYKTATTSLQELFWINRDTLLDKGILYPETGIASRKAEIGPRHSRLVYEYGKKTWKGLVDALINEIFLSKASVVVISTEAWSRPDAYNSLLNLIKEFSIFDRCEIHVIVAFRNIYDYSMSHYREFVRRWGWSLIYEEYLIKRIGFFNYAQLVEKLFELPATSFKFYMYDDNIIFNIIDYIGVLDAFQDAKQLSKKSNLGISVLDVEIIRIFNKYKLNKIVSPPSSSCILGKYGLSASSDFIESNNLNLLSNVASLGNAEKFKTITGLSQEEVDLIFHIPECVNALPISILRPFLEKSCFEFCADV